MNTVTAQYDIKFFFSNVTDKQSAPLEEEDSGLVRVELDMMFTLTDWVELLFGLVFIIYFRSITKEMKDLIRVIKVR